MKLPGMKTAACLLLIIVLGALLACQGGGATNDGKQASEAERQAAAERQEADRLEAERQQASGQKTPEELAAEEAAKALAAAQAELANKAVAAAQANPAGGVSKDAVRVTLTCPTAEAKIVYSLNGSTPTPEKGQAYTGPFLVERSSLVRVLAYIPGGKSSALQTFDYTIDEICVAANGPGDGRRTAPLGNVVAALLLAKDLGITKIKIGAGPVNGPVSIDSALELTGGWNPGFTKRDGQRSQLLAAAVEGSSKKAPAFTLQVRGAGSAAIFDGLQIGGPESEYSTAVWLSEGSSAIFRNCTLRGGSGSYSYGALVNGAAKPVFEGCSLDGGDGASSYGLSIDSARASLQRCSVLAGKGTITGAGVLVTDGQVQIANSLVAGNAANAGYGVALYNSRGSKIEASTLWGGDGRDATALFISVGDPVVSSTVLAATGKKVSYGIYDNYGESAPSALSNLAFVGCATALYYDIDKKAAYGSVNDAGFFVGSSGAVAGKTLAKPQAPLSLLLDLPLGPAPEFRSPAEAPEAFRNGGIAAGSGTLDLGGKQRSEPWSIGAWELD